MKKNMKAFTLIELLIVISIITIISASWVFYFLDFVYEQEIGQKLTIVEDNLSDLDKNIKNYNIFDYELHLNTSTGSRWYITYINNFDLPYNQVINFDSRTWSGKISTNWTALETWNIKSYQDEKLLINTSTGADELLNFDYNKEQYYKIVSTFTWIVLNEIDINYFSEDNLYPENNKLLELISINSNEDKSWTNYSSIVISNLWWSKTIWNNENEIYLFFEENWKEKFIKITK